MKKMIEYSPNIKLSEPDKKFVLNCLPQEWETKVINLTKETKKELIIHINAKTKEHTQKWMESYQTLTNSCYSIENTKNRKGLYKKRYNCIHKTRHREKYDPNKPEVKTKNLDCPAGVTIFLRNRKPTCEIKLRFYHNHSLNDPKLMRFRKVDPKINAEIYCLFELGYKAATALKYLKNIIKLKFHNRYTCPTYNHVYNLYTKYMIDNKIFDNDYVEKWTKNLPKIHDEEKYLNGLVNKENVDEYSELVTTEDGFVLSCCPPIARRVHQFETLSSQIIFIEILHLSDSNKMYLFLTPSEIGCLPLGIILTTSDNISTLRVGFSLLKNKLKNNPNIFVTDGHLPEEVLQTIWPKSRIIISAYHTLKNIWSWLSSDKNQITKDDRSLLFRDFYNIIYAGNEYTFKINFETAKKNSNHANFKKLLDYYHNKKELWGTCYRPENIKSHTDKIKYSEVTIWFLKDMLLHHLKNARFAHVADFTVNVFFQYIKQRLIDFTHKKLRNQFYCDIKLPDESVLKKIQNIGQSLCFVPSNEEENLVYAVNISLCKCTCSQENSAIICEHIRWICKLNYSEKLYGNLTKMENREKCYAIATGHELKSWMIKEDEEIYKTTNDSYKIQIIDEEDDDDISSNKIKLGDNFVAGVFTSVPQNIEINSDDCEINENESE